MQQAFTGGAVPLRAAPFSVAEVEGRLQDHRISLAAQAPVPCFLLLTIADSTNSLPLRHDVCEVYSSAVCQNMQNVLIVRGLDG